MNPGLRVAIVHYHLRRGGVTRVIEHAVRVLTARGVRVAVLAGEAPGDGSPLVDAVRVIPELGYDAARAGKDASDVTARALDAARDALAGAPDLWHVHNHALGKNGTVPRLVRDLARRGARLALQIHDFAEDGRPANYAFLRENLGGGAADELDTALYPLGAHIRYLLLNGRDCDFMREAGAPAERLSLLPNPAPGMPMAAAGRRTRDGGGRFALYPTRAIRRKNLGEFLLWAALHRHDNVRFATTLEPENPVEHAIYAQWVSFAAEHRLPVEFGLGRRRRFEDLLAEADFLMTTSVAEGFGLAFLEGWPAGLDLRGRNLPEITRQFAADGVDMARLYDRLMVPLAWLDRDRLARAFHDALARNATAYGRDPRPREHAEAVERIMRQSAIDFGRLDEGLQRAVIESVLANRRDARELSPCGLGLAAIGGPRVAANAAAVTANYDLDQYGERLLSLYDALIQAGDATDDARVSSRALVEQFQAPERLSLLRAPEAQ